MEFGSLSPHFTCKPTALLFLFVRFHRPSLPDELFFIFYTSLRFLPSIPTLPTITCLWSKTCMMYLGLLCLALLATRVVKAHTLFSRMFIDGVDQVGHFPSCRPHFWLKQLTNEGKRHMYPHACRPPNGDRPHTHCQSVVRRHGLW